MSNSILTLHCQTWADLPPAIVALARDLDSRVARLQSDSGRSWDSYRLEIWEESGRIVAYPSLGLGTDRIDVAGCQIVCPEIIADLEKLHAAYSCGDDPGYDSRVDSLVRRVAHFVRVHFPPQFPRPWGLFDQDGVELFRSVS